MGLDVRRNIKVPINFQCPIHKLLIVWWNQIRVGPSPRPSRRCVLVLYNVGGTFFELGCLVSAVPMQMYDACRGNPI
jgi:hypothetical protein